MRRFKIIPVCILFVSLMLLSSCGLPEVKTGEEVVADVENNDDYYYMYNLSVDSFEITNRQTDKSNKNDQVWISVNASNYDFEYEAEYYVEYTVSDNVWVLESFSIEDQHYKGLHPEEMMDEAEQVLRDWDWYNIEYQCSVMSDTHVEFTFHVTNKPSKNDSTITRTFFVNFDFSPETLWQYSGTSYPKWEG